nr:MAG: putative RNA dependent RNA polymerase [Enontekio alphapartitivirus 1]
MNPINKNANLLYIGNDPAKAPQVHPSYLTYRHVNPVIHAMKTALNKDEIENITEGFRRSDFSQEALIADYLRGEIPKHNVIKDEHYEKALNHTRLAFKPEHTYRPVSFPDLRYYPWTISTSAEAPYTTSKYWKSYVKIKYEMNEVDNERLTFHNLYNEIFRHNREKIHRIKDGIYTDRNGEDLKYWNQAHARSHLVTKDEPDKIRMVYGVPKLLLMTEAMFLWPLVNDLVNRDSPMLWGYETLKGGWYSIYNWMTRTSPTCATYLALDWKGFDKRAQFTIIDDIHDVIRSYMSFEDGYMPTFDYPESETNPERITNLWDWMRDAVKHTPDVLPNGDIYVRQHAGIASGYFQTQLLDSMYNNLMLLTVLSRMGINISKIKMKVQGDDSIIGLIELIPEAAHPSFMATFSYYATEYFGAVLNVKKSHMSNQLNGLPLLGFTNIMGIPSRDRNELLASLLRPERKSDEAKLMARAVGIAYANCGYHPEIYRICENIYRYLQSLGFSPNAQGLPHNVLALQDWFELLNCNDTLEFPTYFETICRLTETPTRSRTQTERLWPTTHFISKF